MHALWGLLSADVHRGNRWRSSFFQMPASMGNWYYYLFLQYVPLLYYKLQDTYCLLQSSLAEKTVGSLGGLILDLFIHMRSTPTTRGDRIFDLERKVSSGYKDDEQDDTNSGAGSQDALCNDPYCTCPNHKNKEPPPPPPSPPPTTMEGYYGEGATQYCYVAILLGQTNLINGPHACVCCLV
jgi:hypothetical protein